MRSEVKEAKCDGLMLEAEICFSGLSSCRSPQPIARTRSTETMCLRIFLSSRHVINASCRFEAPVRTEWQHQVSAAVDLEYEVEVSHRLQSLPNPWQTAHLLAIDRCGLISLEQIFLALVCNRLISRSCCDGCGLMSPSPSACERWYIYSVLVSVALK